MKINGKEMELEIFEADNAERFDAAMRTVSEEMARLDEQKNTLPFAESIRAQCKSVADCFDTIWGHGSAITIFDGKVNLKVALTAFGELIAGVESQKAELNALSKAVTKESGNRAARRAHK